MITPGLLRDWSACWLDDRIAAYYGRRTELTPRQISEDSSLSLDDRLWVLCRTLWYLDESAARGFAIESAALVTHLVGDEDDQAQHAALLAGLLEIEDLPADQRAAALAAAWDAARDAAAWDAARDAAALAAARAAALAAAAWDAARAAARAATWAAAARDAAWAAALENAIARALEWLGDYANGWEEPS